MAGTNNAVRLVAAFFLCFVVTSFIADARSPRSQEPDPSKGSDTTSTSATMRGIFTALTTAYVYSLDMAFFEDRHNRETVLAALQALVNNTEALETHGGGLDPSFDYLRHSLAGDAHQALERYEKRQFLGSQFMLNKMMENCATCHARLPAGETFDTGAKFLEDANIGVIPPVDRVNIEVATRQFDRALATYEEIFQLADMTAPGLSLIGAFESYLKLCIGVVGDPQRPIPALEEFRNREDMPDDLKDEAETWIASLRQLDLTSAAGRELEVARSLVGDAEPVRRAPVDRSRLVEFVAASALLHQYLQNASTYDTDAAEAFYLLAVSESHISRSYWISETEFLLGQAIKAAPESNVAERAKGILGKW